MCLLSPYLNNDNANELLPQVIKKPTREVVKVLNCHFPERAIKAEIFKTEVDDELKALLVEAKRIASESDPLLLLKKVLKEYVREKRTRIAQVKHPTRYIPVSIAREIKKRDNYQCTYLSPSGIRCNQRAHLQIDHIRPYAKGGSSQDPNNSRCLCRAHNLFLAKRDFPNKQYLQAKAP